MRLNFKSNMEYALFSKDSFPIFTLDINGVIVDKFGLAARFVSILSYICAIVLHLIADTIPYITTLYTYIIVQILPKTFAANNGSPTNNYPFDVAIELCHKLYHTELNILEYNIQYITSTLKYTNKTFEIVSVEQHKHITCMLCKQDSELFVVFNINHLSNFYQYYNTPLIESELPFASTFDKILVIQILNKMSAIPGINSDVINKIIEHFNKININKSIPNASDAEYMKSAIINENSLSKYEKLVLLHALWIPIMSMIPQQSKTLPRICFNQPQIVTALFYDIMVRTDIDEMTMLEKIVKMIDTNNHEISNIHFCGYGTGANMASYFGSLYSCLSHNNKKLVLSNTQHEPLMSNSHDSGPNIKSKSDKQNKTSRINVITFGESMFGNSQYTSLIDTISKVHDTRYYRFFCDFEIISLYPFRSPITTFQYNYGTTYNYMNITSGEFQVGRPLLTSFWKFSPYSLIANNTIDKYYFCICNNKRFSKDLAKYKKYIKKKTKSIFSYAPTQYVTNMPEFMFMNLLSHNDIPSQV